MLKEYLSEATSLLAEAVLGAPVKAQALTCWWIGYCMGLCNLCGPGKRTRDQWVYCSNGQYYCLPYDCVYC